MFKITLGKGFQITFKNGYTISVQFGTGNYCSNYYSSRDNINNIDSVDAEIAVFTPSGEFMRLDSFSGDYVGGHVTPDEVLEIMNIVSKK